MVSVVSEVSEAVGRVQNLVATICPVRLSLRALRALRALLRKKEGVWEEAVERSRNGNVLSPILSELK